MRHMRIDPGEGPGDERAAWPKPICVRARMSEPPVTVAPTAPLMEALQQMTHHRIHCLPVVDDESHLIGIVNEDDVLGTQRGARPPGSTVEEVMSAPAVAVGRAQSVKEAIQLMVGRRIGVLPVVEHDRRSVA